MITVRGARVVKGAGRGKKLGVPTINLDPSVLLRTSAGSAGDLKEGIYVCRAYLPDPFWGVMHFGPRPVFGEAEVTWEVMLFDYKEGEVPSIIDVEIYKYLRAVMNFETPNLMLLQIEKDIAEAEEEIIRLKKDFGR